MLFAGVITGIGFLQFFEEPFVMTQGGPLNSTLSVAYPVYNTFGFGNYGVAAAMSYVLFAAVVLLTIMQFKVLGERDDATGSKRRWFRRSGGAVRMSTDQDTKPRGTVGSHIGEPQARPWLYAVLGIGLVLVVTPFVWMASGRSRPRASCAPTRPRGGRRARRWTTSASCSPGSTSCSSSPTPSSSRSW